MKHFLRFVFSLVALAASLAPGTAFAQATLTTTTLSAAISSTSVKAIVVASATGFTANTTSLFVDKEFMSIEAVNGTTITVIRGAFGTKAALHNSGATLYVGPSNYFFSSDVSGGCTSTNLLVLPFINTNNGKISDCRSSGQWIQIGDGTMTSGAVETVRAFCTGTAGSGETEFLNGAACSAATTATARYVASSAGQIANLRVFSSAAAVGGSNKDVLTVFKNGSSTALTCTIAASGTTCSDLTHSVAVAAGDVLTFQFVTATSDTAANLSVGVEKF